MYLRGFILCIETIVSSFTCVSECPGDTSILNELMTKLFFFGIYICEYKMLTQK